MRTFLAISLPDDVRAQLARVQGALRLGRTEPVENLHLTIAFLGEQSDACLDEVHLALQGLRASAPEVAIKGLDVFGGTEPRILFAAVAANDPLTELNKKVRARIHAAGLDLPHERFRPHVTLARLGGRLTPDELAQLARFLSQQGGLATTPFRPAELTLFESVIGKRGSQYYPLASYPLGA